MDVARLQEKLIREPENILVVLEHLGYEPKDHGGYFSMKNKDGDNESAIVLWKNTLKYQNYTRDKHGNIFTLVMDTCRVSFPQSLNKIVNWCGIKVDNIKVHYPFGGFYRTLDSDVNQVNFKVYNQNELPPPDSLSEKFFADGIDFITQEEFGVRFDHASNSILIPIYGYHGELIGCKARNNAETDMAHRWWAFLPYPKTQVLYGWSKNYKSIVEKRVCVITESEKGVQQLYSMNCKLGLGVGGHDISKVQAQYIKLLDCDTIIIAFDEDVEEEELEEEAAKVKTETNKVFYIKDREHKYLSFGGKQAPTDLGVEVFNNLMKYCKVKYKGKGSVV